MKNRNFKTYRIGNLAVTLLSDGITILYLGKERIYEKNIRKGDSLFPKRTLLYFLSIVLLITTVFFIPFDTFYLNNEKDIFDVYDEEKNRVLMSEKTDFSTEDISEPLTIRNHVIQKGDTLSEIAKKFGVSMDTICGSNNLRSYDIIMVGKKLLIPNKDGILYKVKKGQNIAAIVKKYRASIEKVYSENNIKNFDFLAVGSDLFIPDAKPMNIIPGFLWPARSRRITSSYGWRRHPINRRRHFHQGMDIRSKYQLIRATKYGKVTFAGWFGGYGKAIIIAHPGGWKSLYGHLSRIIVRRGQYVKQGQYIGRSGNTGYSSGPHLHFELIHKGRHKNPYRYLKFR